MNQALPAVCDKRQLQHGHPAKHWLLLLQQAWPRHAKSDFNGDRACKHTARLSATVGKLHGTTAILKP